MSALTFQLVLLEEEFRQRKKPKISDELWRLLDTASFNPGAWYIRSELADAFERHGYLASAIATWRDLLLEGEDVDGMIELKLTEAIEKWRLTYPTETEKSETCLELDPGRAPVLEEVGKEKSSPKRKSRFDFFRLVK